MKEIQTKWNLKRIYTDINSSEIERDLGRIERSHKQFEKKYKDTKEYTKNISALKQALSDYEKLYELPKPLSFLFLSKALATNNTDIDARISLAQQRIVRAVNNVSFFRHTLARLDIKKQEALLKNKELSNYRYFLERLFSEGKHFLSEEETKLLSSLSLPLEGMWTDLTERLQGKKTLFFKGQEIPLSGATGLLSELNKKDRTELWKMIREAFKEDALVAEAEINALYTTKSILDEKRGFGEPFEETLLDFETTKKELRALREAVRENVSIAHDFYSYKRNALKLKELSYADRNTDMGSFSTSFSFNESALFLKETFGRYNEIFSHILESMLKDGSIDVHPRQYKMSGAFCSGNVGFPTFVMLNHVDTVDSLSTFAHEMGHALHTELSKSVTPLYQSYSTATAEFASTFFEEVVFEELQHRLSKRERKILLHNRINRDISTVFRQMAFFEFELALHEEVRRTGYVSKERIAELLNEKTQDYMGDTVKLDPDDGYFFVTLSHIRRHFYVYSYAYGGLLSRLLSRRALENPELFQKITELLSRGSTASPHELFRDVGVNTESKKTFKDALDIVRQDLARLRGL